MEDFTIFGFDVEVLSIGLDPGSEGSAEKHRPARWRHQVEAQLAVVFMECLGGVAGKMQIELKKRFGVNGE